MSATVETATDIRTFHVDIPEEELAEMRRRIASTRWPTRELVADRVQVLEGQGLPICGHGVPSFHPQ